LVSAVIDTDTPVLEMSEAHLALIHGEAGRDYFCNSLSLRNQRISNMVTSAQVNMLQSGDNNHHFVES
jgi:hypothetical protein